MNKNLQKFILPVFLMLFSVSTIAQEITVSGKITDKFDGLGIPGVTVLVVGTTTGTVSDLDGFYNLMVPNATDTLRFSFIGYNTVEMPVNGRTNIDLIMSAKQTELDELVVIGYGIQKKKVVTGAIATVDAEEISRTPILRVEQAMQGRTAGVQVTQLSGQPGEEPTVRIRGAGTTGDATPLYIVDGMAVGGIDYLNPGDIESVDVLKDAASSAIYGARAANGVVLITTKGGKIGSEGKMNVTYSGYYGIQNVARKLDMLDADQYRMIQNEGATNAGQTAPFDLSEIARHNTNWQDELFVKNAPMQNHEVSVTGGNSVSSYASSISYFSQMGIIGGDKSQFDRITARLNSNHEVNEWFSFGNNLSYSHIERAGIESNQSFNGPYSSALNMDPLTPLYQTDPDILSLPPYSNNPVVEDEDGNIYGISEYVPGEVVNPLALLETQNGKTKVDKVIGSIFGSAKIIDGLTFKTNLGIDLAYVNGGSYRPLYYLNGAQKNVGKTSVDKNIDRYFTWQWENTVTYIKSINNHNFSILLGTTAREERFDNLTGFNAMVPLYDPSNVYLDMATDTAWKSTGGASHYALFSQFGRITYDFKSKYAFTGILRRDGSSRFGANNRFGTFPSVGFSWLVSDESFFPEIEQISFIKLRTSWGINGNDRIGDYQFVSIMDKSRGYIFGAGRIVGASPEFVENEDIKWEESEQINFALDIGAYNDRLTATIDYYVKNTKDLLERIPIPAHVGNSPPFANVGSVQNRGVEVSVNWRHLINDLSYSFGVNATYNKNEVTEIGNANNELDGATWAVAGFVTHNREGLPMAYFYGYQTDGIFQNEAEVFQHIGTEGKLLQPLAKPGDVRFVDVNGDNVIDPDDRTMIGNPTPDWTLGVNGSANYKNFDFSFLMTGAFGHQIFNGSQRQDLSFTNRTTAILDRWTGEGTSDKIPRFTWNDVNNNYRVSDLYIEDGAFMRLKNIQIGYTLPDNILKKMKAATWRVFVSAENLVTITGYTGADPEIGALSSFDIGIDRGIYPQARTFRFGTTISF